MTKSKVLFAWGMAVFAAAGVRAAPPGGESFQPWPFFPLDNGVGRGLWTPAQQAAAVKEFGYDGLGYNYTNPADLDRWLAELKPRGLRLYSLYFHAFLDRPEPYPQGLTEAVDRLKGEGTILWMTLRETREPGDHDEAAVARVRDLAARAEASGLAIALYPHKGFYVATAADALRIARKADCPNVGVTVNLCHELMAGHRATIPGILREAGPHLALVTVNGAAAQDGPGLEPYIKRLDRGDYDVLGFLRTLRAAGYRGPVGLQGYSVKGDPLDNLAGSMAAWKNYMAELAKEETP